MANDKQKRADELKEAQRKKQVAERGGKYSDRIKYEPYVQMNKKPGPFVPKDPVKKS